MALVRMSSSVNYVRLVQHQSRFRNDCFFQYFFYLTYGTERFLLGHRATLVHLKYIEKVINQ